MFENVGDCGEGDIALLASLAEVLEMVDDLCSRVTVGASCAGLRWRSAASQSDDEFGMPWCDLLCVTAVGGDFGGVEVPD